jgi:hypothetical protein
MQNPAGNRWRIQERARARRLLRPDRARAGRRRGGVTRNRKGTKGAVRA